jgi:hypothetical protein
VTQRNRIVIPPLAILGAVLVLNALLKWRFFCGLVQADDLSYGVYAFSLFRLPMSWEMDMDFRSLRLALLLPVALLFRVFPTAEFVAVLYPMALSFGTIILVWLIGRRLYGEAAGLFAAFVLATFPADVVYGTMLLPDIAVPFWLSLAVWALLVAEDGGARVRWWYAASGFAVFLAFITRENSYYFALFFVPLAFSAARWRKGLWCAVAGFVVPVILLYGLYGLKSGDFLFNLHLAQHYRDEYMSQGRIPPNDQNRFTLIFYMMPVFTRGFQGGKGLLSSMYGLIFYVGIPCLVYTAFRGMRREKPSWMVPGWWFLVVYLFLEFGTVSFSEYRMMQKLPRFLLTLTPPMAIAFGAVLAEATGFRPFAGSNAKWRFRTRWATLVPAGLIMLVVMTFSAGAMIHQHDGLMRNVSIFRTVYREVLADRPNLPVYHTGGWWINKLSFYYMPDIRYAYLPWRPSKMFRDLGAASDPSMLAGSHIILDRRHFSGNNDLRIRHDYRDFGPWVSLPPSEWELLGRLDMVEVYAVPEGWTYDPPEPLAFALGSLMYATEIGDPLLFLSNLHPSYVETLDRESFFALFEALSGADGPGKDGLMGRIRYAGHDGRQKILFGE